jgi:hypothetical protein
MQSNVQEACSGSKKVKIFLIFSLMQGILRRLLNRAKTAQSNNMIQRSLLGNFTAVVRENAATAHVKFGVMRNVNCVLQHSFNIAAYVSNNNQLLIAPNY